MSVPLKKKHGTGSMPMHSHGDNTRAHLSNREWLAEQERTVRERFARWLRREMAEYAQKKKQR